MRKPIYLKPNDKVAIVSTARKVNLDEIQFSINLLKSWGLEVIVGQSISKHFYQYAGTDLDRLTDFQNMLDNPEIKAIFCARGGYGTVRIIDDIDFTKFMHSPKWIIGYSDVSILHAHINTYLHVQTMHASMPINFETNDKQSLDSLKNALFGKPIHYIEASNKHNIFGNVSGEIVGGNLSILYSILGTKSGFNADNKILFIEDIDEMLYHLDRMMLALKRANKLNKLKALIVGGMTEMRDNTTAFGFKTDNPFGKTAQEIILEHTAEYGYPICFDFPSGHMTKNLVIIFGQNMQLQIDAQNVTLSIAKNENN